MKAGAPVIVSTIIAMIIAGCAAGGAGVGQMAPDFSLGAGGGLSGLKGRVVVVDFWATWCAPCLPRLRHLQELAPGEMGAKGAVFLAVDERDAAAEAHDFWARSGLTLPIVLDADGEIARSYGVTDLPATFVIGRDGSIRAVVAADADDPARRIDEAISTALHQNM